MYYLLHGSFVIHGVSSKNIKNISLPNTAIKKIPVRHYRHLPTCMHLCSIGFSPLRTILLPSRMMFQQATFTIHTPTLFPLCLPYRSAIYNFNEHVEGNARTHRPMFQTTHANLSSTRSSTTHAHRPWIPVLRTHTSTSTRSSTAR